jgi:hypothetical protein
MTSSAADKNKRVAQKQRYAPRPKPPAPRPRAAPAERHLVTDEVLKKIIQRVLTELKLPGKIPSEVIFAALTEVRDLVEHTKNQR